MRKGRVCWVFLLAMVIVSKTVASATIPMLGEPGHHAVTVNSACASAPTGRLPGRHDTEGDSTRAALDVERGVAHAIPVHEHGCPQLCMAVIDVGVFKLPQTPEPAAPIGFAPVPPSSVLVSPPLHPPRAGIGAA